MMIRPLKKAHEQNIVRILSSPQATLELYVSWSQGSWVQVMWEVLKPLSDTSSLAHMGLTVTNHTLSPQIMEYEDCLAEKLWLVATCLVRHRSWSMIWHSEAGQAKSASHAHACIVLCGASHAWQATHTRAKYNRYCLATQS
jgi:hypothetical protein